MAGKEAPRPFRARRCADQRGQPIFAGHRPGLESGVRPASHRPGLSLSETQAAPLPPISARRRRAPLHRPQRHESRSHVALHLARAKPARRACLGHQTIAGNATAGGGKAPAEHPVSPMILPGTAAYAASRQACLAEVRPSSRNGAGRFFSAAGHAGFASRNQKNRPPPPATSFRPSGAGRSSPRPGDSHRGRDGRGPEARKD